MSLEEAPPAIFWTRSCTSSPLSSSSCFFKSSLLLPQSWPALTFALVDCVCASVFSLLTKSGVDATRGKPYHGGCLETLSTSKIVRERNEVVWMAGRSINVLLVSDLRRGIFGKCDAPRFGHVIAFKLKVVVAAASAGLGLV